MNSEEKSCTDDSVANESFENLLPFCFAKCSLPELNSSTMEEEIDRVVQAITIASDPSQISLHQQAMVYLNSIEQNASESWRLALPLFLNTTSGGARKYSDQVRFFALRVLNEYLDNRCVNWHLSNCSRD